jgi:hypothetical protein
MRLATAQTQDYFSQVREVAGVRVLALCLDNFDRKALRSFVDSEGPYRLRCGRGRSVEDDKVQSFLDAVRRADAAAVGRYLAGASGRTHGW